MHARYTAMLLTKLCCYRNSLPQGAPTSAYLSNLIMRPIDSAVGEYCLNKRICYTRYADDLSFSGDFDIRSLLYFVDNELAFHGLSRNRDKFKVMRTGNRQVITGIVVNEKLQVAREYRMKIRREVFYIKKYGLDEHLRRNGETREHDLDHLRRKIQYVLFINQNDEKMRAYLQFVEPLSSDK